MKRIEINTTGFEVIEMIWRNCWGSRDRFLIMTPDEATVMGMALLRAAEAMDKGSLYHGACEFKLSANN